MAYRVGARVIDLEYVQFHPTVFHRPGERPFLVSEAVRGEGGVLINHEGTAFMERYHPQGSLAPRDVIARSIHTELLRSASHSVYIDLSKVDAEYARGRFPTINERSCHHHVEIETVGMRASNLIVPRLYQQPEASRWARHALPRTLRSSRRRRPLG